MSNVKKSPAAKTGYGMGVAGLVTGMIGVLGGAAFFIIVVVSSSRW